MKIDRRRRLLHDHVNKLYPSRDGKYYLPCHPSLTFLEWLNYYKDVKQKRL